MKCLDEIFDVWYGVNLEVVNSEVVDDGIPFVSRQSVNNGIVCYVKPIDGIVPNPPNTLSIAVSGSVLSTFFHEYEYYSGRDVYIALPKRHLSKAEMLYYCYIIEHNKFRYNYGRGANKTFRKIMVPSYEEIPNDIKQLEIEIPFKSSPVSPVNKELGIVSWHWFRYDEIFDIKKGFYNKKPAEDINGEIPFVGASDSNNGITSYHNLESIEESSKTGELPNAPIEDKLFEGNSICVTNNGSVGFAYYQPKVFTCTHDVNPLFLNPKWDKDMNKFIALFLCTLIEKERYRWAYGRKWRPKRMPSSLIKLPYINGEDGNGNSIKIPDWQFMEDYIKSLPYSGCL